MQENLYNDLRLPILDQIVRSMKQTQAQTTNCNRPRPVLQAALFSATKKIIQTNLEKKLRYVIIAAKSCNIQCHLIIYTVNWIWLNLIHIFPFQDSCTNHPDAAAGNSKLFKEATAKLMLRYALKRSDFHEEVRRQRASFPSTPETIEKLAFFKYFQQVIITIKKQFQLVKIIYTLFLIKK